MSKRSEFTPQEVERLNVELNKQLGPEFLHQRTGPGGKFTYIEGQSAIHLANELFGFNGWTSELRSLTVDFVSIAMDEHDERVNVGVSAIVRITLKDGTFHEDIGYGSMENSKSKAAAMEKAKKEAATDALKRTLRMFGNVLGNCIYDKNYTSRMQYVKTPGVNNLSSLLR
ncbi:Rad52/22 double-strand break repair protein [Circinella umbellata]|nr:Rad52/22 double-strand break repair protein [Circinella umbellata]